MKSPPLRHHAKLLRDLCEIRSGATKSFRAYGLCRGGLVVGDYGHAGAQDRMFCLDLLIDVEALTEMYRSRLE